MLMLSRKVAHPATQVTLHLRAAVAGIFWKMGLTQKYHTQYMELQANQAWPANAGPSRMSNGVYNSKGNLEPKALLMQELRRNPLPG